MAEESKNAGNSKPWWDEGQFIDFYRLLGIPPDAPEGVIKQALKAQRMYWHPDKGVNKSGTKEREKVSRWLGAAEHTLLDRAIRDEFDREHKNDDRKGPDVRHEAPLNLAVMKGHRHMLVAAGVLKLRAA